MKKTMSTLLATLLLATLASYGWQDGYNVAVSNAPVTFTFPRETYVFIYNSGSNVLRARYGGHLSASTNLTTDHYSYQMPIRAGSSYTTRGKYSVVSVFADTNAANGTTFDIGAE
jgi:hypothetical protein